jgi:hypothetical protein
MCHPWYWLIHDRNSAKLGDECFVKERNVGRMSGYSRRSLLRTKRDFLGFPLLSWERTVSLLTPVFLCDKAEGDHQSVLSNFYFVVSQ